MKAEELRIGNRLYSGVVCEINKDSFTVFDGYSKWNSKHMIPEWVTDQPIPLTEERLKKAGYGKSFHVYPTWIKYVHELQNWYYWFNNKKELKFEL